MPREGQMRRKARSLQRRNIRRGQCLRSKAPADLGKDSPFPAGPDQINPPARIAGAIKQDSAKPLMRGNAAPVPQQLLNPRQIAPQPAHQHRRPPQGAQHHGRPARLRHQLQGVSIGNPPRNPQRQGLSRERKAAFHLRPG